mmetsp:Transcript_48754/g.77942  ORF Transcript_48754/g.77942 Transcript_48754/m.77942 type:complete len:181 (-) Transcript_48754:329-871(-)
MATITSTLAYVEHPDVGHIADQGGEIADLDINHADTAHYSTVEPAAATLEYARNQYPMMDMILITVSIILICICCWTIRGWTKCTFERKVQKIESEMVAQQKMNNGEYEQGIELVTVDSAGNLAIAAQQTHTFSPLSCENRSDDKITDIVNASEPPPAASKFQPQFVADDNDDDDSLIIV